MVKQAMIKYKIYRKGGSGMETQLLEYFIHVATRENISLAAAELHISQPHLSNSIKRLEQELGTPLFNRVGRRLQLNKCGKRFLPCAREIITMLNAASVADDGKGSFTVLLHAHSEVLLRLVEEFSRRNPDVDIATYLDPAPQSKYPPTLFDFIASNAHDPPSEESEGIPLEKVRYFAILSERHPLASLQSVTLAQLRNERFVFIRGTDYHLEQTYSLMVDEGLTPKFTLTANCDIVKLHLVNSGLGIAVISEVFYDICAAIKSLRVIPIQGLTTVPDVTLWVLSSTGANPAALKFLKFIKQSLKDKNALS